MSWVVISSLARFPVLGRLFRWDEDRRLTPDDGQHLLEDDPLSIPLDQSGYSTTHSPVRTLITPKKTLWNRCQHCSWNAFGRAVSCWVLMAVSVILVAAVLWFRPASSSLNDGLFPCGSSRYDINSHTCYGGNFLCPVVDRQRTLKCGSDCYLPSEFSCAEGQLVQLKDQKSPSPPIEAECSASYLHLSDPPYENYFISDCSSASQVIITSPVSGGDLELTSPRLLIAWPAGNSGVVTYFLPENNVDGTLGISLEVIVDFNRTLNPLISGVTGLISLNSSAVLDLAIVGSIRTIRNYVEGGSLDTKIQDAIQTQQLADGGIQLNRIWLDETTETFLTFQSTTGVAISIQHGQAHFEAGTYSLNAWFTYPQLDQLCATDVLSPTSQDLLSQNPEDTQSLSFFSFKSKIVAGGWKFLTYFGRDSLITLLLLQPVLSEGQGGAIETIISAAVERIDLNDGSVCHEETIGDYATYLNEQQGIHSTDAQCDYKMVDTDFFLPIVMDQYFVQSDVGKSRRDVLLATNASVIRSNQGSTYIDLVLATAEKIMGLTAALEKSATKENLIQLKQGQAVGQWRDSESGLGGGRIPYDVNTALVPAALKAIASLSSNGLFPSHPKWSQTAADRAVFWEDNTLAMFEVHIPADEARSLIENYVNASSFSGPTDTGEATSPVLFHGLALDGKNQQPIVKVMNTDDCFRLFLLDPKNQIQLTAYISQVADNILHPFPIGLSTSVGLLVANPAYAGTSADIDDFSSISYHGTVVWSWQMAMMAAGLERQLGRCNNEQLEFCANEVKQKAIKAYNHLWDLIESNREYLSSEVWSWVMEEGDFQYASLGALPRPDGQGSIESDIRQLWSLTFLAVKRNDAYGLERAAQ